MCGRVMHQVTEAGDIERYVEFLKRGIPSSSYGTSVSGARVNEDRAMEHGVVR